MTKWALVCTLIVGAILSGCGTTTASRTASGAAVGAATGAAIGSLDANAGKGAAIGAGVGALGGLAVDQYDKRQYDQYNRPDYEDDPRYRDTEYGQDPYRY